WGLAYKQRYRDFGAHLLLIGIMGKSPSGANMSVSNDNGNVRLSGTAYQPPAGPMEAARSIITPLGGQLAKGPWERSGTAATVHPVGGCGMARIVRPTDLQVYDHPGLHVSDGSVLPGGVFRSPANTIGAIAEQAMDVVIQAPGAPTRCPRRGV